jgi:hypothetical protein
VAIALAVVAVTSGPRLAAAAGPLVVSGAGEPLAWGPGPVPWNADLGTLGVLDNASAVALVGASFDVWGAVPDSAISFAAGAALPFDVTAATVAGMLDICGDGLSPIVFDSNGAITDMLLGLGSSNAVLGFAGPECGTFVPPVITEASAVLNGKFIDGVATGANPEIPLGDFTAVFVHEFGHYVNLDHSQINRVEAFDFDAGNDEAVATMFPFLIGGDAFLTLTRDDEVALASLYPAPSFATAWGTLAGRVLRSDGTTPFQGAYVIARNVAAPRHDAVGVASGALFFPNAPGAPAPVSLRGAFEIAGLTPGASYTVEIERIDARFSGGSSVGPFDVPVALPGPAELWSGDDEAGAYPPDDTTTDGVAIPVAAGMTVGDVDIVINTPVAPVNDACIDAITVPALPFALSLDTTAATSPGDDPLLACTPTGGRNANSVWFQVEAPADGTISVDTAGTAYDTVVAAFTGACGGLGPAGCNDDAGGLQARLTFPVSAGTSYLVEIADFGTPGGGALDVAIAFDPDGVARCDAPAPGTCIAGTGGRRTDCASEWLVEPTPPLVRGGGGTLSPDHRIICRDGDPSCDFDNAAGTCTFHVAVCLNNTDPRPVTDRCAPSGVTEWTLLGPRVKRPKDAFDVANVAALIDAVAGLVMPAAPTAAGGTSFSPPLGGGGRCTTFLPVVVPHGTRVLRARAESAATRPDTDKLRLRCLR